MSKNILSVRSSQITREEEAEEDQIGSCCLKIDNVRSVKPSPPCIICGDPSVPCVWKAPLKLAVNQIGDSMCSVLELDRPTYSSHFDEINRYCGPCQIEVRSVITSFRKLMSLEENIKRKMTTFIKKKGKGSHSSIMKDIAEEIELDVEFDDDLPEEDEGENKDQGQSTADEVEPLSPSPPTKTSPLKVQAPGSRPPPTTTSPFKVLSPGSRPPPTKTYGRRKQKIEVKPCDQDDLMMTMTIGEPKIEVEEVIQEEFDECVVDIVDVEMDMDEQGLEEDKKPDPLLLLPLERHNHKEVDGFSNCPVCARSFPTQKGRDIHLTRVHTNNGWKRKEKNYDEKEQRESIHEFVCGHCGKGFYTQIFLQDHITVKHLKKRKTKESIPLPKEKISFECRQCNRKFNTNMQLKVHMRKEQHQNLLS